MSLINEARRILLVVNAEVLTPSSSCAYVFAEVRDVFGINRMSDKISELFPGDGDSAA